MILSCQHLAKSVRNVSSTLLNHCHKELKQQGPTWYWEGVPNEVVASESKGNMDYYDPLIMQSYSSSFTTFVGYEIIRNKECVSVSWRWCFIPCCMSCTLCRIFNILRVCVAATLARSPL